MALHFMPLLLVSEEMVAHKKRPYMIGKHPWHKNRMEVREIWHKGKEAFFSLSEFKSNERVKKMREWNSNVIFTKPGCLYE